MMKTHYAHNGESVSVTFQAFSCEFNIPRYSAYAHAKSILRLANFLCRGGLLMKKMASWPGRIICMPENVERVRTAIQRSPSDSA